MSLKSESGLKTHRNFKLTTTSRSIAFLTSNREKKIDNNFNKTIKSLS